MRFATTGMSGAEKALAAAGLGAVATMVVATPAEAALVLADNGGGTTALSAGVDGTFSYIKFDIDGSGHMVSFVWEGATAEPWVLVHDLSAGDWATNGLTTAGTSSELLQYFSNPASIGAAHSLWSSGNWAGLFYHYTASATWAGNTGYIGLRLPDGGPTYTYAWVQISVAADLQSVTILNWSGSSSAASGGSGGPGGAAGTPEPAGGGLGLLALGAVGLKRHRRRKEQAA